MNIESPATVYISFPKETPQMFKAYHSKHGLYYFRHLQGKTPRIKFNLCHAGDYTFSHPFKLEKITDIELPTTLPAFPTYDRKEIKDFRIVDNFSLKGSPARIYAKDGLIETGKEFYKLPKPVRVFVLLHEIGHLFYGLTDSDYKQAEKMSDSEGREFLKRKRNEGEKKCDEFALIHYLQMGYNRSMAFYSLSQILSRSNENVDRVKSLFNNIQKTQNAIL